MRLNCNVTPQNSQFEAPRNLSEWVGDKNLLTLAFDAAQNVKWDPADREVKMLGACRPKMLLTLLTYCYASGIYGSQDILQAIQTNRLARYICAHNYPDWDVLRKFRRSHRNEIEQALGWVFQQAWAKCLDEANADYLGYEWFETQLKAGLNATVQSRLEMAILMDGVDTE